LFVPSLAPSGDKDIDEQKAGRRRWTLTGPCTSGYTPPTNTKEAAMSRLVPLLLAVVSLGFAPAPFLHPKPEIYEGRAWRVLGLKLSVAARAEVTRTHPKLNGGMTVISVRPDSPAGNAGIHIGDILLGLHQWEMLNGDNLDYVMYHHARRTFYPLQFYILRRGVVHRGWLHVKE
jgi:hypothetical protein